MLKCGSIKYLSFIKRNKIKNMQENVKFIFYSWKHHRSLFQVTWEYICIIIDEYFYPYFFGKDLLTVNLSTFVMKALLLDTQLLGRMTDFALREHKSHETSFAVQERSLCSHIFRVIHLPPIPITVFGSSSDSESVMFKNRFSAEVIYRFKSEGVCALKE